eukprot:gene1950-biopygen4890
MATSAEIRWRGTGVCPSTSGSHVKVASCKVTPQSRAYQRVQRSVTTARQSWPDLGILSSGRTHSLPTPCRPAVSGGAWVRPAPTADERTPCGSGGRQRGRGRRRPRGTPESATGPGAVSGAGARPAGRGHVIDPSQGCTPYRWKHLPRHPALVRRLDPEHPVAPGRCVGYEGITVVQWPGPHQRGAGRVRVDKLHQGIVAPRHPRPGRECGKPGTFRRRADQYLKEPLVVQPAFKQLKSALLGFALVAIGEEADESNIEAGEQPRTRGDFSENLPPYGGDLALEQLRY